MSSQDFHDLLKIESEEIEAAFKKASISGKGTPQEISDIREAFIKQFLSRYFPFPFRIAKGNIRDTSGKKSLSFDCVVLNPNHPYTVDSAGKHTLIFCDGVDSAIEIKPNIQDKNELERGLEQVRTLKELRRFKTSVLDLRVQPADQEYKEFSFKIPTFIFSNKCKANPLDTGADIISYYAANNVPEDLQVDAVVVNKIGIFFNHKITSQAPMNNSTGKREKGLFYEEWGDLTLARFLILLNQVPGAEVKMSENILPKYLSPLPKVYPTKITC